MAAVGVNKEGGLTQFDCQGQMVPAARCLSRLLLSLFGNLPDILFPLGNGTSCKIDCRIFFLLKKLRSVLF